MARIFRPFSFQFSVFSSRRGQSGQALVEYAIVFPIQLLITLSIIQLAHIFIARQVVEYGAFCAARAALVKLDVRQDGTMDPARAEAKTAALIPISRITGISGVGSSQSDKITIPGWGELARSDAANAKTTVTTDYVVVGSVITDAEATVTHDYELRVPVGNFVTYKLGQIFFPVTVDDAATESYGVPHIKLTGKCKLAVPWGGT